MGGENKASEQVSPFFLYELGPGSAIQEGGADVPFAWRIWAGTSRGLMPGVDCRA